MAAATGLGAGIGLEELGVVDGLAEAMDFLIAPKVALPADVALVFRFVMSNLFNKFDCAAGLDTGTEGAAQL